MEELNLLPNNQTAAPVINTSGVASTTQSQIFIHPDHDAGNLVVPVSKPKSSFLKIEIFFSIIILLAIITTALLVFIAIPRTEAVNFANSTSAAVTTSNDKLGKVNTALTALYQDSTDQSQSGLTLSDSAVSKNYVLGVSTQVANSFTTEALNLAKTAKENFDTGSKVKGFSVPANDPNKTTREIRSLAEEVSSKTADVVAANKTLMDLTKSSIPTSAKSLQNDLTKLSGKTEAYADQAKKTANYFVVLADSTIELSNVGASLQTPKDLDLGVTELTTLKAKFAAYKVTDLPDGLAPYNSDIVQVFNTLLGFFKKVQTDYIAIQSGSLTSYNDLVTSENSFLADLQGLGVTSTNHLIDFWQTNKSLSKWDDLQNQHNDLLAEAKKVKTDNNFFLLGFLGEK